jgi:uncharacterized membrane protein (DUF4010 family)
MNFIELIPTDLINFVLVTLFSLLIGLEQRSYHGPEESELLFGTDRTFTLIGIFGFILYIISPNTLIPFLYGGLVLSVLLGVFYFQKIKVQNQFGLTSVITGLITYCLTPLIYLQPPWMVLLVVVTVLILVEIKEELFEFSKKIGDKEFTTLAKFIVIAGIILPLLSNQPMSEYIPTSPYKIWLAIVVVSAISYLSYIIKKFIFPESGILLSAVLGGMYSSTAVTVVLAKKSREGTGVVKTAAGIIFATGVMYVRILILPFIFNQAVADIFVPVSLNMFAVMQTAFLNCFVSQKDASFPSYEYDGPFSELAQKIQVEQYQKIKTCLGREWFYEHKSPLIRATRGLVYLREMNLPEFYASSRELMRAVENR